VPDKTPCPRCEKIGLVRFENVIKAGLAERHYYCGGCNHSWQVKDDGTSMSTLKEPPPERSRAGDASNRKKL
jgi:transposase-like protein